MNKTLLLTLTFSMTAGVHAQNFNRFKDKTNFNPSTSPERKEKRAESNKLPSPSSAASLVSPPKKSKSNDNFGRSKKNNDPRLKKSDAFVNLNPETGFGPEVITDFNYVNANLEDITKDMQKLTGINLIIAGQGSSLAGKGKINLTTETPITVGDAWKAYIAVLSANGFSLTKSGAFYKVVNNRDIRYTPTKVYTGNYTPDTDNYVMRILPLKNISAKEVVRSFRPFMSRYGRIMPLEQTNTILIQDTGSNINRLVRLIKFTDVPGFEETLQIIPVKNSSAPEIAKLLDQILKGSSSSKFKSSKSKKKSQAISKIIAEQRTNSIIAMTNSDGARQLRNLIKKLDVKKASSGSGRIHIYHLQHGTAETLAKTLSTLVSGSSSRGRSSRRSTLRRSSGPSTSGSSLFSEDVKITADKENNAIVVTATATDYLTLKEVISKLDSPRDQVYVEGLIMETNVNKTNNFGISFLGQYGSGVTQRGGFNSGSSGAGLLGLVSGQAQALGGLFAGIGGGPKITVDGRRISTVNGLITAIASNSSTNVLATPQIMALDNTEATFEVGETIPVVQRNTQASGQVTETIQTQQIKLSLKITPQINKVTRFVKLKINQIVEDFSDRQTGASSGAATTLRSADTTVVVRDKDTVAMGGLMRDKETHSVGKVPLLGDIPVLGWLFRNSEKSVEKVNMIFFLTPRILANYQRDNAQNVKDLLNRRKSHLKGSIKEDSFDTTTRGIYEKVKKQENGPLYEERDGGQYRKDNNDAKGIGNSPELVKSKRDNYDIPDYTKISQTVKLKNSAVKKGK